MQESVPQTRFPILFHRRDNISPSAPRPSKSAEHTAQRTEEIVRQNPPFRLIDPCNSPSFLHRAGGNTDEGLYPMTLLLSFASQSPLCGAHETKLEFARPGHRSVVG